MCIDRQLIEYCSPTLARIKTGSLFSCRFSSAGELYEAAELLNRTLNRKDVYVRAIVAEAPHGVKSGRALIYVYRKSRLEEDLAGSEVYSFLRKFGYAGADCDGAVDRLCEQLKNSAEGEFPHEIGVFLGYPLADVVGFIENAGKNFKALGYWKVYSDVEGAGRLFAKYNKCRDIYRRLSDKGRSVNQLTVGA